MMDEVSRIHESDNIKSDLIRDVMMRCSQWADSKQLSEIQRALVLSLNGIEMSRECTAILTEFAKSNDEYLKQFLAIKIVKGLAKKSIGYYKSEVQKLFNDLGDKPVLTITTEDIRFVLANRKVQNGTGNVTLDNSLRIYRSFFGTLYREKIIKEDPTTRIDKIKWDAIPREPFSEIELELLRTACEMLPEKKQMRARALIEVFISTGCRCSEVAGMLKSKWKNDQIDVLGKGNKWRTVYFSPRARVMLARYINSRDDENDALFVTLDSPHSALQVSGIEHIIREIGTVGGVENVFPHRFRHTTATMALRRGMPLDQVQQLLGHESASTTQIYAKTDRRQVKENHRKYLN